MFTKSLVTVVALSVFSLQSWSMTEDKLTQRSNSAAAVLTELTRSPDKDIPKTLLANAVCVAVVPHVVKLAFGVGGLFGKGLVSCRTGELWSMPSYTTLSGGSFGYQIGLNATDVVLIFVQPTAIGELGMDSFTVGGEAGVAAGPIGRDAEIGTDYRMDSDVYAYSRAQGLYLGIAIKGTNLQPDAKANAQVYANAESRARMLLTTPGVNAPAPVTPFIKALDKKAPRH